MVQKHATGEVAAEVRHPPGAGHAGPTETRAFREPPAGIPLALRLGCQRPKPRTLGVHTLPLVRTVTSAVGRKRASFTRPSPSTGLASESRWRRAAACLSSSSTSSKPSWTAAGSKKAAPSSNAAAAGTRSSSRSPVSVGASAQAASLDAWPIWPSTSSNASFRKLPCATGSVRCPLGSERCSATTASSAPKSWHSSSPSSRAHSRGEPSVCLGSRASARP